MVGWALFGMVKAPLFIDAETRWCVCTGASGAYELALNSSLGVPPKAIGKMDKGSLRSKKWSFAAILTRAPMLRRGTRRLGVHSQSQSQDSPRLGVETKV
ncbi:hypothetical protein PIB30_096525 [Stylosanthes scabra]|uniref:Uncharacterized protein n=1 Tax=Stylosanthes scabra TaxID=79078 RepID=A0ABU6VWX4_9FABA|nr:hypothetical protein [Stylosanthes scabra]